MWICPKCNRSFKNTNQMHGCHVTKLEDLFNKRSPAINNLYDHLHRHFVFENYKREYVPPDVIFYKSKSTFLAVKLKTKWIDIEFFLDYHMDHPLIKKSLQTSKRRFAYVVSIDEKDNINRELLQWINYSYALISG